jgi:intracellular septation protein
MSDKKQISTGLKLGLELGPVVLFFLAYSRVKDQSFEVFGTSYEGFIVVTALFIPLLLAATGYLWWRTGHLSKMQLMTAILVVLFGGMGIWFNDERFFKMKPTVLYVIFAAILGFGLMRGQSYLQYVMEDAMPLTHEGWMIFTRRMALFFAALAISNEVVWRTMSTDTWVTFKTFVLTGIMFVFLMSQFRLFSRYSSEEPKDE